MKVDNSVEIRQYEKTSYMTLGTETNYEFLRI
jgi:hypothetical protein